MNILGLETGFATYPLFVAEISCNHCGSLDNVLKLIHRAQQADADVVKIQVYTPEELTIDSYKPDFMIRNGLWKNKNLYELYTKAQTPPEWVKPIFEYAHSIGIPIFSSVFGERSLEVLEKNNCQAYKISSFEFNDINLIKKVMGTNKPVLLSTGLASKENIQNRYFDLGDPIENNYMLMHCVSEYPCKLERAQLNRITQLRSMFGTDRTGYSDHTIGIEAAKYATILGAKVIEKHFHDPKLGKSEDDKFSASPNQFLTMVRECKKALSACVTDRVIDKTSYQFKRSLYSVKEITKGTVITKDHIRSIRPGFGMSPDNLNHLIGKVAATDIPYASPIKKEYIQWNK